MKNKEKYWDVILNIMMKRGVSFAVDKSSGEVVPCGDIVCKQCIFSHDKKYNHKSCASSRVRWLNEEEDRLAKFRNLPVDTPIFVRNNEEEEWRPRYFSKVGQDDSIYVFKRGTTSFTATDCFADISTGLDVSYKFAKLMGEKDD